MGSLTENLTSTTRFVRPKTGHSRERTQGWRTGCVCVCVCVCVCRGHWERKINFHNYKILLSEIVTAIRKCKIPLSLKYYTETKLLQHLWYKWWDKRITLCFSSPLYEPAWYFSSSCVQELPSPSSHRKKPAPNFLQLCWATFLLLKTEQWRNSKHDDSPSQTGRAQVLIEAVDGCDSAGNARPNLPSDSAGGSATPGRRRSPSDGVQSRSQPWAAHGGGRSCRGGFEAVRGGRRW